MHGYDQSMTAAPISLYRLPSRFRRVCDAHAIAQAEERDLLASRCHCRHRRVGDLRFLPHEPQELARQLGSGAASHRPDHLSGDA